MDFIDDPANMLVQLYNQPETQDPLNRLLYVDAKTALPESLLLLTDKMGMATSLEVRVPFLRQPGCRFCLRIAGAISDAGIQFEAFAQGVAQRRCA